MSPHEHRRAVRILTGVFAFAVIASIVHYTDNYVNFADFPQPRSVDLPNVVIETWIAFTALGVAGYLLFRRRPSDLALLLLAAYSASGLIGVGHYLAPGATSMPWWRQGHVWLDIAGGAAMLAFAVWAARARARGPATRPSAATSPATRTRRP
jgi:hypothetical protein